MSSTLLQLVQQATGEMGLSVPSTVIGNAAADTTQMLYLINALGSELVRKHPWQKMTVEYRFTTTYYTYTVDTVSGSTTISAMSSTTGLTTNPTYFMVTGAGINQDTYLVSVNSGASTAVLSQAATATGTTVSLTFAQTKYAFPSDYDRPVDRTQWDKSKHWEMLGPETSQQWQWLKSGFISTGPRVRFRPLGGLFQIWPALGSNEYLGFEYLSNLWVLIASAASATKTSFTVDGDTCLWSDRLMVSGLKMKYFQIKGFDATVLESAFAHQLELEKSNDTGSGILSFAPRISQILIGWENIPDAGYGS